MVKRLSFNVKVFATEAAIALASISVVSAVITAIHACCL